MAHTRRCSVTKSSPEGGGNGVPWTQAPRGVTVAAGQLAAAWGSRPAGSRCGPQGTLLSPNPAASRAASRCSPSSRSPGEGPSDHPSPASGLSRTPGVPMQGQDRGTQGLSSS